MENSMENVKSGSAIRAGGFFAVLGFIPFFFGSIFVIVFIGRGDNSFGFIMGMGMLSLVGGVAAVLFGCGRMAADVDEAARLLRRTAGPREGGRAVMEPAYGVAHSVAAPDSPGDEATGVIN